MQNLNPTTPKTNRWLLILIVMGIILTAIFGFRTVRSFAQIQLTGLRPGTTDAESIRGWMTVPYIARVYCIPADALYQRIGIPAAGNNDRSLADLNKEYFNGQKGIILQKIKDAIHAEKPVCPTQKAKP